MTSRVTVFDVPSMQRSGQTRTVDSYDLQPLRTLVGCQVAGLPRALITL